jgi:hypothetical protein
MSSKPAYDTEIYVTESGYVAITQPDPEAGPGQEDDIVLLSADQLPQIIKELTDLLTSRAEWENGDPEG